MWNGSGRYCYLWGLFAKQSGSKNIHSPLYSKTESLVNFLNIHLMKKKKSKGRTKEQRIWDTKQQTADLHKCNHVNSNIRCEQMKQSHQKTEIVRLDVKNAVCRKHTLDSRIHTGWKRNSTQTEKRRAGEAVVRLIAYPPPCNWFCSTDQLRDRSGNKKSFK